APIGSVAGVLTHRRSGSDYLAGGRWQGPQSRMFPQPSGAKPHSAFRSSHVFGAHSGGGGGSPTHAPRSNNMYKRTFSWSVREPTQCSGNCTSSNAPLVLPLSSVAATWKPLYATRP